MNHRGKPFALRDLEVAISGLIHACNHLESLGIVGPRTWSLMVGRVLRVAGYLELTPEVQEMVAESMKTAIRISGAVAQMEADTFAEAEQHVTPDSFDNATDMPDNVHSIFGTKPPGPSPDKGDS